MRTLLIYDSLYGNTERIAQAIASTLATYGTVQTVTAGEAQGLQLADTDLLVVGAPTHGSQPSPKMRAWLNSLPPGSLTGVKVAAFDTRVAAADAPLAAGIFIRLFGYAAPRMARRLSQLGGTLVIGPEGFFVRDTQGPLKEGELERSARWAHEVAAHSR